MEEKNKFKTSLVLETTTNGRVCPLSGGLQFIPYVGPGPFRPWPGEGTGKPSAKAFFKGP